MKILLCIGSMLLLGACSSAPARSTPLTSSFSIDGNTYTSAPTSVDDPRLYHPQLYMDDDKSPAEQAYRNLPIR